MIEPMVRVSDIKRLRDRYDAAYGCTTRWSSFFAEMDALLAGAIPVLTALDEVKVPHRIPLEDEDGGRRGD